jgi:ABC-2 type transport system ATP-binding protein
MMDTNSALFEKKIEEVKLHFYNNDVHLGYRRLLDCVLETQDLNVFDECILLHNWVENTTPNLQSLTEKCIPFLDNLKAIAIAHASPSEPLLITKELVKQYLNNTFQLGSIDLTINYGEVWGLVGENGNGKTTLLRILAQELTHTSGSISYDTQLSKLSEYNLRTQLTYIPQRTPKWYGSLKDNLKFTAAHYGINDDANEKWVMMYIIRFGLYKFRNYNWSQLSSGYKMRFELARTFLRKPKLLLLDEPLANLDILAQQIILEDLKLLAKSISQPLGIILSSQQLFEVEKVADKIIFLKNGAPILMDNLLNNAEQNYSLIELETDASRDIILNCCNDLHLQNLTFNGGQFHIELAMDNGMNKLLTALVANNISIKYVRDITHSSRRFFTK